MLPPADIAAIRERADAATPGPWHSVWRSVKAMDAPRYNSGDFATLVLAQDCHDHPVADCSCNGTCRLPHEQEDNATFIVASREDVPALLAHIDALTARVAELEAGQAWRPIETAPKDGAQFIAINKYGDATYPVKWDVDRQMWVECGPDGFDTMAWIRAERFDQWMPIPEPQPR